MGGSEIRGFVLVTHTDANLVRTRNKMLELDYSSPSLKTSQEKSFGRFETMQYQVTTECFIAVWKCLFSEHKFRGQIQGMSRNKAYHHVN